MTRKEIIDGLKMTMGLITFDPSTGEDIDPDDLNDLNRTTYDACKCAVKLLESQDMTLYMNLPEVSAEEVIEILKRNNRIELLPSVQPEKTQLSGESTTKDSTSDCISRQDFDKCLENAEKEAVKNQKYVFASALNTIRGNLRNFPSKQPEHEYTMEEFMYGQDVGNPEDGSL